MFFRGHPCQRLKPVSEMGCALLEGPVFHLRSDDIRHIYSQIRTRLHRLLESPVCGLGKTLSHHRVIKDQTSENIVYFLHDIDSPFYR